MKVTATLSAFLMSGTSVTPQQLQTEHGVRHMCFRDDKDYWLKLGYTYIGEATITVDVPDEKTLIDSKVEALREEIKTTRADATAKVTQLEGQIQQLLAIEFTPSAPAD
jgi:hypothetical protein